MTLRIRLTRSGAKKRPYYRIVIAEGTAPRDGRFIEKIGTYDPMLAKDSPNRLTLDEARARHWLSVGAQPTDRVARWLSDRGIQPARTVPTQTTAQLPKKKAQERAKAAEAAAAG